MPRLVRHLAAPLAAAAALIVSAGAARAQPQINTGQSNGQAGNFGAPNTATVGQTFTAPVGAVSLDQFTFQLIGLVGPVFTFQGYVAAWDGQRLTGPLLYTSGVQTSPVGVPAQATGFTTYTFSTGGVAMTPGQMYVAFLNASSFAATTGGLVTAGANLRLGENGSVDSYAGGQLVYDPNGSNFAALSTDTWGNFSGEDAAFTADFSQTAAPEPAAWALLGPGLLAVAGVVRRRRVR